MCEIETVQEGWHEMRLIPCAFLALILTACQSDPVPPEIRLRSVVSSAPYKYITWSPDDTPETQKQVRAHNRAHSRVIAAEKKARADVRAK